MLKALLTKGLTRLCPPFLLIVATFGGTMLAAQCARNPWVLVWHDEFDGAAGTAPSALNWTYDLGNGGPSNPGWGNRELQNYTDATDNVFLDGKGHLVIRALRTTTGYTSGRIKTQGKYAFGYGKLEARIRIPYATGIWPAFWMLGDTPPAIPWPRSGEIDVMENFGGANNDGGTNHAAVHGPGYAGKGIAGRYTLPHGAQFGDDFHVYAVEWRENKLQFFVDGQPYFDVTPADLPAGARWVFNDRPFYILLNVAVGGAPAPVGYPDSTTVFPQDMVVDYVRVYQREGWGLSHR